MLFRKSFRLTSASNKQYSSSEITQIVLHDTEVFWIFIFSLPQAILGVTMILTGSIVIFQQIGYCGIIMVVLSAMRLFLHYLKGKRMAIMNKKQGQQRQRRTLLINESFSNIKTVKLFGWEPEFLKKVEDVF